MIEPPKLAVFLFVVAAHLAVLGFGFPNMRTAAVEADRQSGSTAAANLAVVDQASTSAGLATGSDTHQHGPDDTQDHQRENAYGHGAAPRAPAAPASTNSSATRAGHRSQSESDGPVDTVPTLEEHRRRHSPDEHDHDHDGESELVDPERIAHNNSAMIPQAAENPDWDGGKIPHIQKPDMGKLAVAPKPPSVKPLPTAADESKPDVPARPTPVQMIIPEKPVAKPSVPELKPVAKPTTPTKAPETPRARPVANASKPVVPTSNRVGSGRMKNLRPIKKP